jgi:hypothetical protein
MKHYPLNPRGKMCLCGNHAVAFRLGSYVCQRCMDCERDYYGTQVRGKDRQKRKPRMNAP